MKVKKVLKRLKREFIKVNIFQSSLDALIFFLTANLALFLFSIQLAPQTSNIKILTAATIVFFLINLFYRTRNYSPEIYEEKNPELREVLRTARDNIDSKNIVSQALFNELTNRTRKITSESIIPHKEIVKKSMAIGILSLLTVTSGIIDLTITDNTNGEILAEMENLQKIVGQNEEIDEEFELQNGTDIFGEPQQVEASENTVDFEIQGEAEEPDTQPTIQDLESRETITGVDAPETQEDLELAKQYMLKIREIEN